MGAEALMHDKLIALHAPWETSPLLRLRLSFPPALPKAGGSDLPPPPRHPDTSIGFTVLSPSLSPTSLSFLACPIWLGQPSSSGFLCALCIICGSFQFPLHLAHPLPQCLSDL